LDEGMRVFAVLIERNTRNQRPDIFTIMIGKFIVPALKVAFHGLRPLIYGRFPNLTDTSENQYIDPKLIPGYQNVFKYILTFLLLNALTTGQVFF
jgi:hypothetical protein